MLNSEPDEFLSKSLDQGKDLSCKMVSSPTCCHSIASRKKLKVQKSDGFD